MLKTKNLKTACWKAEIYAHFSRHGKLSVIKAYSDFSTEILTTAITTEFIDLFLFITGNAILIKKHKSMPLKILVGYLINTFFLSIGGMLTQFFLLPWRIFFIYVLVFDGLCLVISLLLLFKNRDILTFSIKELFKNYLPLIATYCRLFCFFL